MKSRKTLAAFAAVSLVLAACGDDDDDAADEPADEPAEDADEEPADDAAEDAAEPAEDAAEPAEAVCPPELTVQTDWFPELEHGGTYQLIGTEGEISQADLNYSGPVQDQYAVGGLESLVIETARFDKVNAAVLLDGEADMAYINLSDVIKDSAAVDMVAIAKTLDLDPQMIMWDPEQYDISAPEDIAATGAPVLHFAGVAYIDYMVGSGFMTEDQKDPSYDGSDAKFVAENGSLFQQGFATNEVYKYENEIPWKDGAPAPVDFFTVGDLGFDNYPAAITMMRDKAEELSDCLDVLVPVMQQAWIDYLDDPDPIMDKMIEINEVHAGFWTLSEGVNSNGFALLEEGGFAENSFDGTYCSFDPERVQGLYDILRPIYDEQGVEIADSIDGIFTNEYCDDAPAR